MINREFNGKTEDEAIELALETLKLGKNQVQIKTENKSGFLGFGKKEVSIKVSFEEDMLFGNRCLMLVKNLLEKMDVDAKIYLLEEDDERVVIEIESPESAIIIGKKGKNLESIQTIINVIMNKNFKTWTKIIIDIGNYRMRRERNLKKIAIDIARQVKEDKKPVFLEPMNPFERRIIHMALKDFDDIETISEGDGNIKRIKVVYQQGKV